MKTLMLITLALISHSGFTKNHGRRHIIAEGSIQERAFRFEGQNMEEIRKQCEDFAVGIPEIKIFQVSFNGNKAIQKEFFDMRGYHWTSWKAKDLCSELYGLGSYENLLEERRQAIELEGVIEGVPFELKGNRLGEVHRSCVEFIKSKQLSRVKDMAISLNGSRRRGVWVGNPSMSDPHHICNKVVEEVPR